MEHSHGAGQPLAEDAVVVCPGILPDGRVCGLTIGAIVAGLVIIRRGRMEVAAERVHGVRCYRCGTNVSINIDAPTPGLLRRPRDADN